MFTTGVLISEFVLLAPTLSAVWILLWVSNPFVLCIFCSVTVVVQQWNWHKPISPCCNFNVDHKFTARYLLRTQQIPTFKWLSNMFYLICDHLTYSSKCIKILWNEGREPLKTQHSIHGEFPKMINFSCKFVRIRAFIWVFSGLQTAYLTSSKLRWPYYYILAVKIDSFI